MREGTPRTRGRTVHRPPPSASRYDRARCALSYREGFSRIGRSCVASNVFLESLTTRQSRRLAQPDGGAGTPSGRGCHLQRVRRHHHPGPLHEGQGLTHALTHTNTAPTDLTVTAALVRKAYSKRRRSRLWSKPVTLRTWGRRVRPHCDGTGLCRAQIWRSGTHARKQCEIWAQLQPNPLCRNRFIERDRPCPRARGGARDAHSWRTASRGVPYYGLTALFTRVPPALPSPTRPTPTAKLQASPCTARSSTTQGREVLQRL